jgi:hypothetical protein
MRIECNGENNMGISGARGKVIIVELCVMYKEG